MRDTDNIEGVKLLQLLEAVSSVLEHEDAIAMYGAEILGRFADIQHLLLAWHREESILTHEQRLNVLKEFTAILTQQNLLRGRGAGSLH